MWRDKKIHVDTWDPPRKTTLMSTRKNPALTTLKKNLLHPTRAPVRVPPGCVEEGWRVVLVAVPVVAVGVVAVRVITKQPTNQPT